MTKKEFREEMLRIKREWQRLAELDPTYYHRSIHVVVEQDTRYIEALYDGRGAEEYTLKVRLDDGDYRIYVLAQPGYINPVSDVMDVIEKNGLDWEYCNTV